ncbi:PIN2/TERF1-interacting telomerase inhibitor 1 [Zerene cesonia]|uniref:PIN2/TERF1-interacting telomerase inhibitor 1 n=1 Tax=Zerene cesonia TaxID=33412 RepID=UPI0018E53E85|nr:PIN2/TERF1-interacting telomerase inhibitor 1 [Zerene cesonia]
MSMLAEPRRKQKIINLRAKNNAWSNDTNKFGQRMLEKMGWSSGKGLGAKENGIVEHVVARYKNDEKGLGYEDKNDQWTKHEDDFNALLANLSNDKDSGTEILHSGVSLEKKSKKSKARIHYHKFTRGKDISRYSEKDLANIFGKKSFHNKSENVEETVKDEDETVEKVFTERGSMEDYFKSKMASLKSKNKITPSFNDNSNNNYCDFAFRGFSCTNGDGNSNANTENNLNNPVDSQDVNQESQIEKIPKKVKKKKSKNKETVSDSENKEADYIFQGFSNSESVGGMDSKADLTEDSREKSFVAKKDKKKKKKAKNNDINVEENITEEVVIKEGKKKRNTEIDTEIDKSCLVEQDIDDEGAPKKKKKRKNKDL